MAQDEKQLLLKDLCARLPYGVKVWYKYETCCSKMFATSIRLAYEKIALSYRFDKEGDWFPIEEAGEILIKPYLRPMSSITDDEKKEYKEYFKSIEGQLIGLQGRINWSIDWLNTHHIDYHGLIEKGLALEAPEGLY